MLHKVVDKNDIVPGTMKQVQVMGKPILLANVDGKFFAIGDICTHKHCNLSTGFLDGSAVYCPCHGGQFDVTTGKVLSPPPVSPEPTYTVVVQNEEIFVDL